MNISCVLTKNYALILSTNILAQFLVEEVSPYSLGSLVVVVVQ